MPSPIGPLTVVREDDELVRLGHVTARAVSTRRRSANASDEGFDDVVRQLTEYFAADRTAFDLPLRPVGSEFELAVLGCS